MMKRIKSAVRSGCPLWTLFGVLSRKLTKIGILAVSIGICLNQGKIHAEDWSQFRGPNQNGIVTEKIRTNWTEELSKEIWRVKIDPAQSSMSVSDGRVFTQVRRSAEICIALDAASGEELWDTPLGRAFYPDGYVGPDDGPRSTPVINGDKVYVMTSYLLLVCMDVASGELIWSHDMVQEYNAQNILWQNAASPLLEEDLVLVNTGGRTRSLVAFH